MHRAGSGAIATRRSPREPAAAPAIDGFAP
jgi:hypothetical protein